MEGVGGEGESMRVSGRVFFYGAIEKNLVKWRSVFGASVFIFTGYKNNGDSGNSGVKKMVR